MIGFPIGELLNSPQGTPKRFLVDEPFKLERTGDLVLIGNVKCAIHILKLPHELNVQIRDFHAVLEGQCSRCLKRYTHELTIPFAEREFIIDLPPRQILPGEDSIYIDRKDHTVNLDPMIQEEILLHFPPIPLCSESCKGLCDQCGIDFNKKLCTCNNQ